MRTRLYGTMVVFLAVFSLPVNGYAAPPGQHADQPATRTGRPVAETPHSPLERKRTHLNEGLGSLLDFIDTQEKAAGKPLPLEDLKRVLRAYRDKLNGRTALEDFLPGEKLDATAQGLLLDNIQILMDYALEALGLFMADDTTSAANLEETAASNIKKK